MRIKIFGKYKSIVISLSLFVFIITGVMVLNLLISTELERGAVEISIAGRQRMLSQRIFKDLLNLQREAEIGGELTEIENQIVKTAALFDNALSAFTRGGVVIADDGYEIEINKIDSESGLRAIEEASILWAPFKELVEVLSTEKGGDRWIGNLSSLIQESKIYNPKILEDLDALYSSLTHKYPSAEFDIFIKKSMYIDRISKEIFELKSIVLSGDNPKDQIKRLNLSISEFNKNLSNIQSGNIIKTTGKLGKDFESLLSEEDKESLSDLMENWAEYKKLLQKVSLNQTKALWLGQLSEVIAYGRESNLTLLLLMDDLAAELENIAVTKAARLRYIQTAAIIAAFLFLLVILLRFVRQLRKSDAIAEKAQEDMANILSTVEEELFLLDQNSIIGSQLSESVKTIFSRQKLPGITLHDLLSNLITERDMQLTDDYIELLFGGRVNEKLVSDINPLNEVEINLEKEGGFETKYLSFNFNRVYISGKLENILVTVNDISETIELKKELDDFKEKSQSQLDMLINLLHIEKTTLESFLKDTYKSLNQINEIFRESQDNGIEYRKKLDIIFRIIHKIKGDAAALGIESFEYHAHEFENQLSHIRDKESISGNDFLPLTIKLNDFMTHHASVSLLSERFGQMKSEGDHDKFGSEDEIINWEALEGLANRISLEHGKQIDFNLNGLDTTTVPQKYAKVVWDIAVQLVRNSVVHGIETPYERLNAQKNDTGKLDVSFNHTDIGYELVVRDDGCGIDYGKLIEKARHSRSYSEEDIESWNHDRIISLIFEPGFSTASEITRDAGRGVGMDIVKEMIEDTKGEFKLETVPGAYFEFKVQLPG